jgi:tetratricopeptide (TPR) repeat protein
MIMSKGVDAFDEAGLLGQVRGTDYGDAIAYCEDALDRGAPAPFWRRQLAYCLFLDEGGPLVNQWERAPAVFEELVRDEPEDPNLRFWRGYLLKVALAGYDELGLTELRRAFDLDPDHPYANLVLAAYEGPREAIPFLERTLSSQPRNFRAIRNLASRYAAIGRTDDARQLLALVLEGPPFVDDAAPLILRQYVNSVLTGAYWAEQTKVEIRQMLANDDRRAMIEG